MAAASIAYNTYLLYSGDGLSGDSIRIGDITLNASRTSHAMSRDTDGFLAHISDLLIPEGFAFALSPADNPCEHTGYTA